MRGKIQRFKKLILSDSKIHLFQICGTSYRTSAFLLYHKMTLHSGGKKFYMCDHCGFRYVSKGSIKMHIQKKHRPKKMKFRCNLCMKGFTKKHALNKHLESHSAEKDNVGKKAVVKKNCFH